MSTNKLTIETTEDLKVVGLTVMMFSHVLTKTATTLESFVGGNQYVKAKKTEEPDLKEVRYWEILEMIGKEDLKSGQFTNKCFNFLLTHEATDSILSNLPDQSIGIVLKINPFDFEDSEIYALKYKDWESVTARLAAQNE